MARAEIQTTEAVAPSLPMSQIWRTIRGYILWSHERGTIQYDVMVTLILLFVFLSPRILDFHDKPVQRVPHPTGVAVAPDGKGGLIYQVDGSAVKGGDDSQTRRDLLTIIEPISGEVSIKSYEAVRDGSGQVRSYRVWVTRN